MPIDITNKEEKQIALTGAEIEETLLQAHLSKAVIEKLNGLEASASEIDGSVNSPHPAMNNFLYSLQGGSKNISILVNGDSTGNGTDEWVYYFTEWLFTNYPEYTVRYRGWNTLTKDYNTPVTIGSGTGSFNIDIWNWSMSGQIVFKIMKFYEKAVSNINDLSIYPDVSDTLDLVIINHSHNSYFLTNKETTALTFGQFTEVLLETHPTTSLIMIRQNPNRDDYNNKDKVDSAMLWAEKRGFAIANAWDKFMDLNRDASLYLDNVHPSQGIGTDENPTGQRLMRDAVIDLVRGKITIHGGKLFESCTSNAVDNLIKNGDFLGWSNPASSPDGFSLAGGVSSQDSIEYIDSRKGYSWKIVSNGGASCFFDYNLPSTLVNELKGKRVFFAIRMKVDEIGTGDSSNGFFNLLTTNENITVRHNNEIQGTWGWRFGTLQIKHSDTICRIRVVATLENSAPAGETIYIDKIVLGVGLLPKVN